jgi:hypothetical protein
VGDKFERMWEEAVVAYFKVLSRNLPGGTEENHQTFVGMAGLRVEPATYRIQSRSVNHSIMTFSHLG